MILICPVCKYPVNYHGGYDVDSTTWIRLLSGDKDAECKLSEAQATHAAQRAAALLHLSKIAAHAQECKGPNNRLMMDDIVKLWTAADAYRAVGILENCKK